MSRCLFDALAARALCHVLVNSGEGLGLAVRIVAVHLGILHRRRRLVARILLTGRRFLHLEVVLGSLVLRGSCIC